MKNYIILGMKRSGHHAIVYWIAHNLAGKAKLYNNCRCSLDGKELILTEYDSNIIGDGKHNINIFNIEDFNTNLLKNYDFRTLKKDKDDELHIVLVLRNPFNWIASSVKGGGGPCKWIISRVELWKKQAKLFLNNVDYNYIYMVNYDKWFSNIEYRYKLSSKFNLDSFDNLINFTSPRGNGSSFDKLKFKNKAQDMKVLERWKFLEGTEYNKYLNDKDLIKYSNEIFKFNIKE